MNSELWPGYVGAALPGIGLAVGGAKLAAKGAAATSRLGKVVNKTLDGVTGARTYLTASAKAAQAGQAGTAVIKSRGIDLPMSNLQPSALPTHVV